MKKQSPSVSKNKVGKKIRLLGAKKKHDFSKCNSTNVLFRNLVSRYGDNAILFWDSLNRCVDIFILKTDKEQFRNAQDLVVSGKKYHGISLSDTLGYEHLDRINSYLGDEFMML